MGLSRRARAGEGRTSSWLKLEYGGSLFKFSVVRLNRRPFALPNHPRLKPEDLPNLVEGFHLRLVWARAKGDWIDPTLKIRDAILDALEFKHLLHPW